MMKGFSDDFSGWAAIRRRLPIGVGPARPVLRRSVVIPSFPGIPLSPPPFLHPRLRRRPRPADCPNPQSLRPPSIAAGPAQRLSPKPRVSPAITTADPLLTRLALGRSNDGSQFGMFLQIFADGTVLDSEGVHHLRPADLKPIVDVIQSGDLLRIRGHCGAPATDFIEYVHIVVYDRRLGRLSAHSFSYSGNPQGCDHSVRHVHTALENIQAKLSRQPGMNHSGAGVSAGPAPMGSAMVPQPGSSNSTFASPAPPLSPTSSRQPNPPAVDPLGAVPAGPVIPLTPVDLRTLTAERSVSRVGELRRRGPPDRPPLDRRSPVGLQSRRRHRVSSWRFAPASALRRDGGVLP